MGREYNKGLMRVVDKVYPNNSWENKYKAAVIQRVWLQFKEFNK